MSGFISPVLNYSILAPILIVLVGALLGVLVEAFAAREKRAAIQLANYAYYIGCSSRCSYLK
jgi:NADH-quinone oxidoreductase subunit N